MASVSDATTRLQESYDLERSRNRDEHERELQDQKQDYESELRSRNEEYNRRLQEIRAEAQGDVKKLKENLYDRYGKIRNNEALAIASEKDQLSRYKDQIEKQTQQKVDRIEKLAQDRAMKTSEQQESKVEQALANQQRSHAQEVQALQDELAQYRSSGRDVDRERAEAKEQEIREYEGKNLDERQRIIDSYERSIARLHDKQDELGEHYNQRLTEATFDAENRSKEMVRAQKNEFTQIDRDRQKQIDRLQEHFDQEVKNERRRNDRTTDTLITQSSQDKERALQAKDATYAAFLKDDHKRTEQERTDLEAEVRMLRTTGDATKVSPYVVDKIEKNAEMRYYQQLQAANDVHHRKLDAARERDQEDRMALQQGYQESLKTRTRDMQRGQDVEKKQFLAAYDDLQHLREDERQNLENRFNSTFERTQTKQALEAALTERRHKDQLEEQRDSLQGEKVRNEDELILKSRMDGREWAAKYQSLRRDYERKMVEERDAHDTRMTELRYEYDKKLRDSDRKSQRALDDRVKMYEHLIQQQELSFKEKERFLTEHYEEELDRMKATNARLIQKKS